MVCIIVIILTKYNLTPFYRKKEEGLGVEAGTHTGNPWAAKWQNHNVSLCLPFAGARVHPPLPSGASFNWGALKRERFRRVPLLEVFDEVNLGWGTAAAH